MHVRWCLILALALGVWSLALATTAQAELVFFTSGRVMSVKTHTIEGDRITLFLRSGGEMDCSRTLIARVEPDEVPYPEEPAALPETSIWSGDAELQPLVEELATEHGLDAKLVTALIRVESNFRPEAVSKKGAAGLMQLMPATATQYAVSNVFEPRANLDAGMRHLKSLLIRFGDLRLALAAYNAGIAAVEKFGRVPPYRETQQYVRRILELVSKSSSTGRRLIGGVRRSPSPQP